MPIRVILYEDNDFLRNSIADLIQSSEKFEWMGAFINCDNVADEIKELRPDVVLMDIEMAGTNGLEGLRIIRNSFQELQVIMLTVFDDNENIFEAIRAGASGYLLKKTAPEKILDAIEDVYNGGAPITSSIAKKVLQLFPKAPAQSDELHKLTEKEQEVLQQLMKGNSYKMIAAEMNVKIETVRSHIKQVYSKLHAHSATEAIAKAYPNRNT